MEDEIIQRTIKSLEKNNFEVYFAKTTQEANTIFFEKIYNIVNPKTTAWGDSQTMKATGIINDIQNQKTTIIIPAFDSNNTYAQKIYWRKKALEADLFITGSNAVTVNGQIVNLDMIGNRIGGIVFGPEHVVLFIGVNKIVDNIDKAFDRVRQIAAPLNAKKHINFKTPCQKTGYCMDCMSPDRICNTWTITEKSFPPKRIKIILINEELGL